MTAPVLFPHVELLAVLAAAVAAMAVGLAWYSPALFLAPWLRGIEKTRDRVGRPGAALALTFATAVLGALGVAVLYDWLGRGGVARGIGAGAFLWLVAALPVTVTGAALAKRPWLLVPVDAGFYLAGYLVSGAVVGLFG
jgi:hypothetical protein